MVNGRHIQNKHRCLNLKKKKSFCGLGGKASINMGFMKRNSEIF